MPSLKERIPDLADAGEIDRIVCKCMAKSAGDRYQSVSELRDDLVRLQKELKRRYTSTGSGEETNNKFARAIAYLGPDKIKWCISILAVAGALAGLCVCLIYTPARVEPQRDLAHEVVPEVPSYGSESKDTQNRLIKNMKRASLDEDRRWRNASFDVSKHLWVPISDEQDLEEVVKQINTIGMNPDWLDLSNSSMSDEKLKLINQIPIRGIRLKNTKITDRGVRYLDPTLLAELDLEGTRVTDESVQSLADCRALYILSLARTDITDRAIKLLAKSRSMRELSLAHCRLVTGSTLEYLRDSPIQLLCLDHAGIRKVNLNKLCGLKLTTLDLSGLTLSDKEVKQLRLPLLETLQLNDNSKISDDGVLSLVQNRRLKRLGLQGCPLVTAHGIEILKKTFQDRYGTALEVFTASDSSPVRRESVLQLH